MNKQLVFGDNRRVVFATALIASLVVDQANARKATDKELANTIINIDSTVVTAGANSPVTNSGNNAATETTNTNNGGNAAAF